VPAGYLAHERIRVLASGSHQRRFHVLKIMNRWPQHLDGRHADVTVRIRSEHFNRRRNDQRLGWPASTFFAAVASEGMECSGTDGSLVVAQVDD
jgi:hypothetical protein